MAQGRCPAGARGNVFDAPYVVIFLALAVMTAVLAFTCWEMRGAIGSSRGRIRKWRR